MQLGQSANGTWTMLTGVDSYLVKTLARSLNFTWQIKYADSKWGTKLRNGSWDGIVGHVMRQASYLLKILI